jgi:CRP/FNR family cyclic AMP-dependent transcriptional regulator
MGGGGAGRQLPPVGTFLAQLSPDDQGLLRSLGRRRSYGDKRPIIQRGEDSRGLVIILDGVVKVSAPNPDGVMAMLAIRGAGDVVGEMSMFGDGRRGATVTALNTVDALQLDQARTEELLRRQSVARALIGMLIARLREADDLRLQLDGRTQVIRRLAWMLSGLSKYGEDRGGHVVLEIRLSQRDLASFIGASRSAVAKALRDLRDRQILTTDRQRIVILEPSKLAQLGQ